MRNLFYPSFFFYSLYDFFNCHKLQLAKIINMSLRNKWGSIFNVISISYARYVFAISCISRCINNLCRWSVHSYLPYAYMYTRNAWINPYWSIGSVNGRHVTPRYKKIAIYRTADRERSTYLGRHRESVPATIDIHEKKIIPLNYFYVIRYKRLG